MLTGHEARRAVPALVRAFWTYPETIHLLPDETRRRRVLPRYLTSDALDSSSYGRLLGVENDGEIVGAAAWLPPEAYPVSMARQLRQVGDLVPAAPWAVGAARRGRQGQRRNREVHAGRPPHYWLRAIGVDPDWQGKGIGTVLLRPVLDRADLERRGCYLVTAVAKNVGWYQGFGFTTVDEFHPTPTWPKTWAMWRAPAATAPTVRRPRRVSPDHASTP